MVVQQQLAASLMALALVSLGAAVVGLYAQPRAWFRGFWFMWGVWGFIDGAIAWSSLIQEPLPLGELHTILGFNLLLQAVYLPIGVVMASRSQPILVGMGWGILVQALALAAIDANFYVLTLER